MKRPLYTLEYRARWGLASQKKWAIVTSVATVTTTISTLTVMIASGKPWQLWLGAAWSVAALTFIPLLFREARSLKRQYEDFLSELPYADYYELEFSNAEEASDLVALIAERTREPHESFQITELNRRHAFEEEIEIASIQSGGRTILYLNAGAKQRCAVRGIPLPEARAIKGADLPKYRVPVLVGDPGVRLGSGDVRKLLKG